MEILQNKNLWHFYIIMKRISKEKKKKKKKKKVFSVQIRTDELLHMRQTL